MLLLNITFVDTHCDSSRELCAGQSSTSSFDLAALLVTRTKGLPSMSFSCTLLLMVTAHVAGAETASAAPLCPSLRRFKSRALCVVSATPSPLTSHLPCRCTTSDSCLRVVQVHTRWFRVVSSPLQTAWTTDHNTTSSLTRHDPARWTTTSPSWSYHSQLALRHSLPTRRQPNPP